jgi:hypothetical protein
MTIVTVATERQAGTVSTKTELPANTKKDIDCIKMFGLNDDINN